MWTKSTEQDIVKGVLIHGPAIIERCLVDPDNVSRYLTRIYEEKLNYPIPKTSIDTSQWFIPEKYNTMDIEEYLYSVCPKENHDRLVIELDLYKKNNMIQILRVMKYIVDILRKNDVVWGVGRGSSVASYVLYLIGVHRIDSVKYKLPIEEFFKGGENG
jgi:DNA polymerase III alpha subunit